MKLWWGPRVGRYPWLPDGEVSSGFVEVVDRRVERPIRIRSLTLYARSIDEWSARSGSDR